MGGVQLSANGPEVAVESTRHQTLKFWVYGGLRVLGLKFRASGFVSV